jgi:hypothetical protein
MIPIYQKKPAMQPLSNKDIAEKILYIKLN